VKARVTVMLKEGVLDPQGTAIGHTLEVLGFAGIGEVRVGRVIEIDLPAAGRDAAQAQATEMAQRLLANTVIERFTVEILS